MSFNTKIIVLLVAIGVLAGGVVFWVKRQSSPPVQVVVRLSVRPPDQVSYVLSKANSARFKYFLGKVAATKPYLAQKLELKPLSTPGGLEAHVGVQNQEEATLYARALVDALQTFCGSQVQLTLDQQNIRSR